MNNLLKNSIVAIAIIAVCAILYLFSSWNYLAFHSMVEGLSILVTFTLFLIAFNTKDFNKNKALFRIEWIGSIDSSC
jgi:hypothetical protein